MPFLCSALLVSAHSLAQAPQTNMDPTAQDRFLQSALAQSTLTTSGKPFHAELTIGPASGDPSPGAGYTGHVELWWSGASSYRFTASSLGFPLSRIVVGDGT